MLMLILLIVLVGVITSGILRMEVWRSRTRMLNTDWLDDTEKFKLISRWGRMA